MTSKTDSSIESLIKQGAASAKSEDALRFTQAALNVANVRLSAAREQEMVPAEPEDMNEALIEIANALDTQCNLEDILHAIDRLRE